MDTVTLDFETYWDTDYTLKKMSPLSYVRDDRFEVQFLSAKVNRGETVVAAGDEVSYLLKDLSLFKRAVLGHNMSGFDCYVLAYHYGIHPRLWMCTMAMARPIHSKDIGLSLAALAAHYGLGTKDRAALYQTRGRRLADFTPQELADMRVYNRDDTDMCRGLFDALRGHFTPAEMWQIDAIVRMRTEPKFMLDRELLKATLITEREAKQDALVALARRLCLRQDLTDPDDIAEAVRAELASSQRFAVLLRELDVEVPMKPSPTGNGDIPALAKSDDGMKELLEHDDPLVAEAARCRLAVKSTLLETRIEKLLVAAEHAWGRLPIPVKYCGADTTGRDSGEEYNPQNFPRIVPGAPKPSDNVRRSLAAPRGHKVIVADQSGIELRINHFLWKVPSSMALYRADPGGADLYRAFAASPSMYNTTPEAITKPQRQVGKISQLGLGFGAGDVTFQRIAKTQGGIILPLNSDTELSANSVVRAWRYDYREIVEGWATCDTALRHIAAGLEREVDPWGLVHTCKYGFVLPSGRIIRYPDLRREPDGEWPDGREKTSWFYAHGRHKARITGPKADENIVQALARDSVFEAALEFYRQTGRRFALRVHDELVYVVPADPAHELLETLQSILRTPPAWWPELVVWSEGDCAGTYGDAK